MPISKEQLQEWEATANFSNTKGATASWAEEELAAAVPALIAELRKAQREASEKALTEDSVALELDAAIDNAREQIMSKQDILDLLMLLSALESWSFSVPEKVIPDYLQDRLTESVDLLTRQLIGAEE